MRRIKIPVQGIEIYTSFRSTAFPEKKSRPGFRRPLQIGIPVCLTRCKDIRRFYIGRYIGRVRPRNTNLFRPTIAHANNRPCSQQRR